jgi:glycosyltransferase involved in cell wall biosynthesis
MNLVAGMDVCLLPFTRDAVSDAACPLKLFEYAALRKPIISTRTEEVSRIGDGWIAFGNDPEESAAVADDFLCNTHKAQEAGERGRELVERKYNWPMIAAGFAHQLSGHLK